MNHPACRVATDPLCLQFIELSSMATVMSHHLKHDIILECIPLYCISLLVQLVIPLGE